MKKGIVMDIDSQFVTLLTQEGEFLKAKNRKIPYKIGEEIDFFPIVEYVSQKGKLLQINKWRWAVASSIAILLIFLSFFPYYLNNQVYAYMSIDVNPSLELGVNRNLKVISLKALNNDGKKVAARLHEWKRKNVADVTKNIISECNQDGYLKDGKTVLITTVMNKDSQSTEKNLQNKMAQLSTNYKKKDINIETVTAKKEDRQKAISKGISTGQLLKIENKLDGHDKQKPSKSTSQKAQTKLNQQNLNKSNNNGIIKQNDKRNSDKGDKLHQDKMKTQKKQEMNQSNGVKAHQESNKTDDGNGNVIKNNHNESSNMEKNNRKSDQKDEEDNEENEGLHHVKKDHFDKSFKHTLFDHYKSFLFYTNDR